MRRNISYAAPFWLSAIVRTEDLQALLGPWRIPHDDGGVVLRADVIVKNLHDLNGGFVTYPNIVIVWPSGNNNVA
jgi:hypothetical protein